MASHFHSFTNITSVYYFVKDKLMANESSGKYTVQILQAIFCTVTEPRSPCESENSI